MKPAAPARAVVAFSESPHQVPASEQSSVVKPCFRSSVTLGACAFLLAIAFASPHLLAAAPPATAPKSFQPALDQAAQQLAEGHDAEARAGFQSVVDDTTAPAFVRALAYEGLAQSHLAGGDHAGAIDARKRQAADTALLPYHRALAERQRVETERLRQSQPARRPEDYRETLPVLPRPSSVFHVAPQGSDQGDGSREHPFATLERARDAVRQLRQANADRLPIGGVAIELAPGEYPVRRTFNLTAEDSGTAEAPVVYRAATPGTARLRGGERIPGSAWKPVADPTLKSRLDSAVADRVREVNLDSSSTRDWGDATALRKRPELFVDGVPQTLARWPNQGFVKTGEILGTNTFKVWNTISGCKDGRFRFVEDRPRAWRNEPDVRLYGYWFWDWFEEYQTVAALDLDAGAFTLAQPFSNYGYRKNQRYYAVNVLRELDQPGEWYLDRPLRRLLWLPPPDRSPDALETIVSVLDSPFIQLTGVHHVVLLGLILEEGRADGIHVSRGNDTLIAGCTLRRLGGDGIVIDGGQHHGVFGCRLETLGCGGIQMAGGDRARLEPGRHFVENCTVADISRLKRTYTPAVHLDGCGSRIAHNRFENMPSSALRIEGNDHTLELNWIRDVVKESDDQGGVDMFGNPLYRGVVIRWNRWSDIGGGTHNGAAGVRLDDMISGVVVQGNLFERCGAVIFGGVQIHGGKDNWIDGNLFVDGFAGVSFTRWGDKRWNEAIAGFLAQAASAPYTARYPELAGLTRNADVNDLSRNLFVRCGTTYLRDGGVARSVLTAITDQPIDPAALSPTLTRPLLFPVIPLAEIGPYPHPWTAP